MNHFSAIVLSVMLALLFWIAIGLTRAAQRGSKIMKNLRMQEKLDQGECIDVNRIGRSIGHGLFILGTYDDGVDYCDAANDQWIWSIGKDLLTEEIIASTDTRFYQHPQYRCLWLR